jgi:hypothetical protein
VAATNRRTIARANGATSENEAKKKDIMTEDEKLLKPGSFDKPSSAVKFVALYPKIFKNISI